MQQPQINIVATANSAAEMLKLLATHQIDILLSDVMMPEMNGQALAKAVKLLYPHIKIIALSMSNEGAIVEAMINDADIVGYLLKQTGAAELVSAIEKIYNGGIYFQPSILDELEKQSQLKNTLSQVNITLREKEIIKLMEKDLSNKEMADTLNISIRTVETHRKNIFAKTGTNNALTLVKWAYEHKLI